MNAVSTLASAAQFSVTAAGPASPDQTSTVTISVSGDGATQHVATTLLFDHSRLSLGTTPGPIAGAGQNGASCALRGSNRVEVNRIGSVLPAGATVLCSLSFQVWPQAAPGAASLELTQNQCSTDFAPVTPCTGVSSSLQVTGSSTSGTIPNEPENRFLFVLLDTGPGAPTLEQITGFDFSSGQPPPLASLTVGGPIAAFPYLLFRAQGDFAQYLSDYPDTARAKLERYLLVEYRPGTNLDAPLSALQNDQYVAHAQKPLSMQFSVTSPGAEQQAAGPQPKSTFQQYHLDAIRAPQAWARAGGWGLVGIADSGIAPDHPDLRSLTGVGSNSGSLVPGGNYLPYYSYNLSDLPQTAQFNPDERIPVPTDVLECDEIDGINDQLMTVTSAGHGTHVSGLIAANHTAISQASIEGVCRNCGLGVWKIARAVCVVLDDGPRVIPFINPTQAPQALTLMSQIGVQVVNQSFGNSQSQPINGYCAGNPLDAYCLALQFARETEVMVSAAAGNARTRHQFPARDYSAVAVGGSDETGGLWDESPGGTANCPTSDNGGSPIVLASECGSNFTAVIGERRSEIVTPARRIRSTMYPGFNWNPDISCGDAFGDTNPNDGIGLCTGTSMSTPIASGIYGQLRSINPLLPVGSPEVPVVPGLRSVVVASTRQAQASQAWSPALGYGEPDMEAASRRILGLVGETTPLSRVTPLFTMYSVGAQDYAAVATPQAAMALARYQAASYATTATAGAFIQGDTIPGYAAFPAETGTPSPVPRASAYVLTTEYSPVAGVLLQPLYYIDRTRRFPINCVIGSGGCNTLNRDFALISSESRLNAAIAAGYRYAGIHGYVYQTSAPGTQALRVQCRNDRDDCAVFLENQRTAFESDGYTGFLDGMTDSLLGYAYPTADTDQDGLPDGMERAIGTSPTVADSDGDGSVDGNEYPLSALPLSDPCTTPAPACTADLLFRSGFE